LRDVLTGLAILLILMLAGATAAPHFIDWDRHRSVISEKLSASLGQEVEITGPISVTLLPAPTLKLAHIKFGGAGAIRGTVGRFRAQLAVPPLLRGDLRITEARLQGADLLLAPAAAAAPGGGGLPLAAIGFDRLQIEESRLSMLRADGAPVFAAERVDGQLEASSLLGPLRGSLAFDVEGERRTLRFSTGRFEAAGLRARLLIENQAASSRADFDGLLRLDDGGLAADGAIAASGNVSVQLEKGTGHLIWRLAAKVKANGAAAALDAIELALGNTERQTVLTGSGDVDFAREGPVARAILSTRQLDLDRLLTADDPRLAQTPEATVRSLLQALAAAPDAQARLAGEVELTAGNLLFGGDTVLAPKVVLRSAGGLVSLVRLSGELPGRTQVAFEGAPSVGARVAGRLSVDSRDLARLAGWYQGSPPRLQAIRTLRLTGDLRYDQGEARISDATLVADEMKLSGSIRLATDLGRPRLTLNLAADQLDIAKLPDLPESDQPAAWDLDLAIDAKRVRYAGVGAGEIALRLRKEGDATLLDGLTIRDLDGADLIARGRLGGAAPRLDMRLRASRMDAILQLADRLSSHWGIPVLASRAASLAPADLTLTWGLEGDDRRLTAKGRLADTEIDAQARLSPAGALAGAGALALRVKAPNPAGLLRQIGLDAIPVVAAGAVDLRLSGGGASASAPSVDWSASGLFGGARIELTGRQTTSLAEPFVGRITMSAADLAPLAQTLLIAVPAVPPGQPFRLDAGFDLRGYRFTLRDMDMRAGVSAVKGEIAFNLAEFGRISGQLRTGALDASSMGPLIFGLAQPARPAGPWDRRPFGPAATVTLPGDLWIEADSLDLGEGVRIGKPRFVLRFDNGLIYVEHAQGDWLDGRLTGQATLRRSDRAVSLTARLALDDGRLDRLPLAPAASGLRGLASAQLEASAIGESPAALVAALSGVGRATLKDASVLGLASGALDSLLKTTPADFASVARDALAASLERRLTGQLALGATTTQLALGSGVLRVGPLRVAERDGDTTLQAALDLKDLTLDARAALRSRDEPKGWAGPPPAADVRLRGPWAAPARELDVSNLANGLAAIAIQREQERIEVLEQDQRERGFFNRRLKAAEEQRRAEEEERRRVETERRAAEEARKRAEEDERRRAEDDRRRIEVERRAAEEARRRAEEEDRRRIEAERRALEALRRAEDAQRRIDDERQRRAEDAARREAARQQSIQPRIEDVIRTLPPEEPTPPRVHVPVEPPPAP